MVNSSSQKFLNRGRAPRVQIEYDMELYGAEKKIELPFVVGVMADLSGDSLAEMAPVEDRRFVEIDSDNLNDRLRSFEPRVAFQVPNLLLDDGSQITVDLNFESMHDFSPSSVVNKVPGLHNLFSARTDLSSLLSYMDGRPSAEDLVTRLVTDPSIAVSTDFKALLREAFSPRSEVAVQTIEKGLATLVMHRLRFGFSRRPETS